MHKYKLVTGHSSSSYFANSTAAAICSFACTSPKNKLFQETQSFENGAFLTHKG